MSEPRTKEVFLDALDLPPERRSTFLERACEGNPARRREIESLLSSHDGAGEFMTEPAGASAVEADTSIGPYRLLERIGEGGFGFVYLAEQSEPVHRRVALKVLKGGMSSREHVARFEAEKQALAMMDHPHVARVLDGARTPDGRPYFVMELVRGSPIRQYCDDRKLSVRARLELFLQVCRAIQHAHQKGIIHRDLKPSNVIVATHDGQPCAKVIDFGVAKVTAPRLREETFQTLCTQLIGTPQYLSPEQARLDETDVDTRSDVYSLGVLLYELLTDTTPFTRERMRSTTVGEWLRIVIEEDPPTPSTRLASCNGSLAEVAAARDTDSGSLLRTVRGDLDWIVMRALEKDRQRRYESASALANDIERHLRHEPVQARPPSIGDRARKFVRRNRVAVTAASFALVLVFGAIGIGAWFHDIESARRERIHGEIHAALATATTSIQAGRFPEARDAVRRAEGLVAAGRVDDGLRASVARQARDVRMVADLESARLARAGPGLPAPDSRHAHRAYDAAFRRYGLDLLQDDLGAWTAAIRDAAIRDRILVGLDDWYTCCDPQDRARLDLILEANDPDAFRRRIRDAIRHGESEFLHPLAESRILRARLFHEQWRLAEALAEAVKALEIEPTSVTALCAIGAALQNEGRLEAALERFREATARAPRSVWCPCFLGHALRAKGAFAEAAAAYRKLLAIEPRNSGGLSYLGLSLLGCGEVERALDACEEAVRVEQGDPALFAQLGHVRLAAGDADGAVDACRKAVDLDRAHLDGHVVLAAALLERGSFDAAVDACRKALRLGAGTLAEEPKAPRPIYPARDLLADAVRLRRLAWVLVSVPIEHRRDAGTALEMARQATQWDPRCAEHWRALGLAHYRAAEFASATNALRKAHTLGAGEDAVTEFILAMSLARQARTRDAREHYDAALRLATNGSQDRDDVRRFRAEAAAALGLDVASADR